MFMDPYLVHYPRQDRNLCAAPVNGIGSKPDPRWDNFRSNLGYILRYSRKLNLTNVVPSSTLCSTHYCLAQIHPSARSTWLTRLPEAHARSTSRLCLTPGNWRLNGSIPRPER